MSTKYRTSKLADVANIKAGRSLRGKTDETKGTGVKLIQMRDMNSGDIDYQNCMSIELGGKAAPNWIMENDVLLLSKGSNPQIALVDKSINKADSKLVSAPYIFILRVDEQKLTAGYLAWILGSKKMQEHLKSCMTGDKSLCLSRVAIENIDIVLPPLDVQKDIARYAESIENKNAKYLVMIEENKERIDAYGQFIID